ncbi:MAG: pyridoxamine 5'-phosphate oxidase family protein, partial [Planctomycetota bacterium]
MNKWITDDVRDYLRRSVLCWLATADSDGAPNVSPKEVFLPYGRDQIIIANIASPKSVSNIRKNAQVCVSFVCILSQKGYQLKGLARLSKHGDEEFDSMKSKLETITRGDYPFSEVIVVDVNQVKPITAPGYHIFPDKTEAQMIEEAR